VRTLAIDCATEACSVALFDDYALLGSGYEVLGRGHAERLVPMIAELPERGRADRILVSLGPGSFTGVRIGLAAARALALAWKVPVLGYPTLALVAAMNTDTGSVLPSLMESRNPPDILVCMAGGHGEWFVQPFNQAGYPVSALQSLSPEAATSHYDQQIIVGSRASEFAALRGSGIAHDLLPNAAAAWQLPAIHLTTKLAPIYGRPPDARLPA
jgi:tRNA threonylcarbamoyl adenosine modification protein YeaZ